MIAHERRSLSSRIWKTSQLLIALFVQWQVSTLLHLSLEPHALCPEGGEALHVDREGDPSHEHRREHEGTTHDGCRHLFFLTSANITVDDGPLPIAAADTGQGSPLSQLDAAIAPREELFRLAPSHSPPDRIS